MPDTKRLADYLFELVAAQGVRAVFLVPGGGSMYLVDALQGQNLDIEFIPTHHEQAASIAAEAYARVTGGLGCALVSTGPGGTNALTAVAGSWIESVPLLIISGQVKRADLMGNSGVSPDGCCRKSTSSRSRKAHHEIRRDRPRPLRDSLPL